MAEHFKLILTMCRHDGGQAVYFKQDGQRFENAHTVKINDNTEYDLKFTLKPGKEIQKLMVNGERQKLDTVINKTTDGEAANTYVTKCTTEGFGSSKSGKRKTVHIVLEFEQNAYVKLALQCKVYKYGETSHAQWGQALTALDMDCQLEQGHTYVTILKEKYL